MEKEEFEKLGFTEQISWENEDAEKKVRRFRNTKLKQRKILILEQNTSNPKRKKILKKF